MCIVSRIFNGNKFVLIPYCLPDRVDVGVGELPLEVQEEPPGEGMSK